MKELFFQFVKIGRMIKIEHSVFALPYAWAGLFLAAGGLPPISVFIWLSLAMICVRSFAMTFNRIVDKPYDCENPRTSQRALCTGEIDLWQAWLFCLVMALGFILFCYCLNKICLVLAVPVLFFVAIYSLLKRFTPICHYWLGGSLGLAPVAGWLALNNGSPCYAQIMLFCAVTFWVAAFDIYYAFQDTDFDKDFGLHSIPADWGDKSAMTIAAFSHILTVIFLVLTGIVAGLGWPWYVFCAMIGALLAAEHKLVKPDDLRNINMAFFTLNGIISPLVLVGIILGTYI